LPLARQWLNKPGATFTDEPVTEGNDMTKSRFTQTTTAVLLCGMAALSAPAAFGGDGAGDEAPGYRPFTLGAEAGSTGLGGSASWRFADHFGARAGMHYFSYDDTDNIEGINYNAETRWMSEPLGIDFYPWKNCSFRVTAGVLLNQSELTGISPSTGAGTFVNINGNDIDSGAVGDLALGIENQPVAPYLAIGGVFYLDRARRWSVGGEIGVAYTGDADVTLTRNGPPDAAIDAQLAAERQQVEDDANDIKFYPIVKVNVNFSF
jgi:hypothetical protein